MTGDRASLRLRLFAMILAAALVPLAPLCIVVILQVRDAMYARSVAERYPTFDAYYTKAVAAVDDLVKHRLGFRIQHRAAYFEVNGLGLFHFKVIQR